MHAEARADFVNKYQVPKWSVRDILPNTTVVVDIYPKKKEEGKKFLLSLPVPEKRE